jgi:hypothetical protein
MSFIKDVPDYKTCSNENHYMSMVPSTPNLYSELEAYAARAENLVYTVNELNNLALKPPTTNWGGSWLLDDLSKAIYAIKMKVENGNFPLLMDTICVITKEAEIDIDDINNFLLSYNIGYYLQRDFMQKNTWHIRDDVDKLSNNIDATIKVIKESEFEQAIEHLQQAKKQLENVSNERSRKDTVRDCASAMESIVNILGGTKVIGDSTKSLRETKQWGLDDIIKDGNTIFGRLHILYPDFRHGSTEMSTMSLNEAMYWVGRITIFIDYIARQKNDLGL